MHGGMWRYVLIHRPASHHLQINFYKKFKVASTLAVLRDSSDLVNLSSPACRSAGP